MKKVCFVTTMSVTIKAFVFPTLRELVKRGGYDITVICNTDDSLEALLPPGVRYIPVKMKRGISLSAFGAIRELKKIFQREKFDYIQYSTPNAALYCSIAAKRAKCPIRLYGQWGIRYVGMSGIKRKIFKRLERCTCNRSTHIRSVSPLNMKFGISEGLYSKERVKVIGNGGTVGVNLALFDISQKNELRNAVRQRHFIGEDSYVFGFVGRMGRDKGSEELLLAFRKMREQRSNVFLCLVGPDEMNNEIPRDLVEWARNDSNVVMTGNLLKDELPSYYASFDCYVHPTYREGFGMVIQEAGAMGNAIITTRVPGASEVMVENESCILVEPKNVGDLYDAMALLSKNKQRTAELGNSAYKRTVELYETGIMVNNICDDIKMVMENVR